MKRARDAYKHMVEQHNNDRLLFFDSVEQGKIWCQSHNIPSSKNWAQVKMVMRTLLTAAVRSDSTTGAEINTSCYKM